VGGVEVLEPFQIALRRSSFFGRKEMPAPEGRVFDLFRGLLERE
jgi:hypothetical protein